MKIFKNLFGNTNNKINASEIAKINSENTSQTLDNVEIWETVYSNDSGTSSTITLSKSCEGAKKAKIYTKNNSGTYLSVCEITSPNGKTCSIIDWTCGTDGAYWTKWALIKFNNNQVIFSRNYEGSINQGTTKTSSSTAGIYVTRIDLLF